MTLTRHGWHIPNTTLSDEPQNFGEVRQCGGVYFCGQCSSDEATVRATKPRSSVLHPEPYSATQMVSLEQGDEFITGTLNADPWIDDPNEEEADGNDQPEI